MAVYYNDNDPNACEWLQNLIDAGAIPAGVVDCRSIEEVQPDDVKGYAACHFFAGIGGWPEAIRLARYPVHRGIWTASCPCPPFSVAGKKRTCPECGGHRLVPCLRRVGYFVCAHCEHAWHADARHLWPAFWRLAAECRPPVIVGEQVTGRSGRLWLAGVRGSLEVLDYGFGAADLCGPCVGAPNIRQRLYWLAYADGGRARHAAEVVSARESEPRVGGGRLADAECPERRAEPGEHLGVPRLDAVHGHRPQSADRHADCGADGRMGDAGGGRGGRDAGAIPRAQAPGERERDACGRVRDLAFDAGEARGLVDAELAGLERHAGNVDDGHEPGRLDEIPPRPVAAAGDARQAALRLGDADRGRRAEFREPEHGGEQGAPGLLVDGSGTRGPWDGAVWIDCADGKARRIEPGLVPLVDGIPGRVGRLRAYGNAIMPHVGAYFLRLFRGEVWHEDAA